MPGKRIIVLEYTGSTLRYALRADVPVAQSAAYVQPGYVSSYGDVADPDLAAIKAGTVAEVTEQNAWVRTAESGPQFIARVQAALEARWAAWSAELGAKTPRQMFGRFWNGTIWSNFP